MSNITNTERVAVALFGWEQKPTPEGWEHLGVNWYEREGSDSHVPAYKGSGQEYSSEGERCQDWPDFTDERLAPYWCDRMQRELVKRGLIDEYVVALWKLRVHSDEDWPHCKNPDWVGLTLATPAQRLEAAVRVLDEVGL